MKITNNGPMFDAHELTGLVESGFDWARVRNRLCRVKCVGATNDAAVLKEQGGAIFLAPLDHIIDLHQHEEVPE